MSSTIHCRLFVVDDERVIKDTWTLILRDAGFDAIGFASPVQALERMRREHPGLLISDVLMPEMSGITLALRAKVIDPAIQILLISGMASTEDLTFEARAKGFHFPILTKPVHPTELIEVVRIMVRLQPVA